MASRVGCPYWPFSLKSNWTDMTRITHSQIDANAMQTTARLVALCWIRQIREAGDPEPDLRKLTAQVLREVRQS